MFKLNEESIRGGNSVRGKARNAQTREELKRRGRADISQQAVQYLKESNHLKRWLV